ncbi:NIL domain-containing protein [Thermodesulfatator autotrophicus]|uniref:(Fe-S)-binding protein n=1 Tax=Thermodesulfatator autotrophicus TaxID=1795632 RepID=A0A177E9Q6_9BACT|nr:NIL domain-containing protein [Thermodesulfatator autotrophicus]OAG28528.1 (Fe-S)-binding protein [Thermodesulfatator autotrophicus]
MYKKILVLRFPAEVVEQPIVYQLVKEFDLSFNILKATILPGKEGLMVMELAGHPTQFNKGLAFLRELGVEVKTISQEIRKNEEKCIHCGFCTAVCPTNALYVDRETMEVKFDPERCTGCELCMPACIVRAMEAHFHKELVEAS